MKFLRLVKGALTGFLVFYLSFCLIKAQETKTKTVNVNKRKYSILEDQVVSEHGIIIKDKETLLKVLRTEKLQEDISSLRLNPAALKALELYTEGQRLTIKYNEHIDWTLRLPAKVLANLTIGQKTTLEDLTKEFTDLTIEKLKENAEEIAEDPEKQLKHLAYEYFSKATEKAKFNLKTLRKGKIADYETTMRFEENGYFIQTFIEAAQKLYHDIENLRKLEERWTQTFLEEITKVLPDETEKITDFLFQKYEEVVQKRFQELEPYKRFQETVAKKRKECEKSKDKKQKELEKRVKELVKRIKFDKNTIVYVSNITGNFEIYSMTKDGKNKIQLTYLNSRSLFPKWTSNEKIVFCSRKGKGKNDLYLMDKTGTFIQQITDTKDEDEGNPIILSNGNLIFISDKNGNEDIYLKEAIGGTKQLTNTKEDEADLDISPDKKWICFSRSSERIYRGVFILNLENGLERKLDKCIFNPRFSPDGEVGYSGEYYDLTIKNIHGTKQSNITKEQLNPKEPNTKEHIMYFLGWMDKDTIMYRFDLVKLPEKPKEPTTKNIYSYNLKTKEIKKLTNTDTKFWNDHADCLKK